MAYYTERTVDLSFDEAVEATEAALADEGFGVLCDVDVAATMEEKLGLDDQRPYRILGACNPELAHEAMAEEEHLGVLLPCNVVVYETESGAVTVAAVDPAELLSVVDNDAVDPVADEVAARFERVLDAVAA